MFQIIVASFVMLLATVGSAAAMHAKVKVAKAGDEAVCTARYKHPDACNPSAWKAKGFWESAERWSGGAY